MNKRLYLQEIRDHDISHETSFIRELEMIVDSGVRDSGYSLQFWRDMILYGLREAVLYAINGNYHNKPAELKAKANEILRLFGRTNFITQ